MVLKKTVVCPTCNEKLIFTIKEENVGNGPLFSLACLHKKEARVLIATFDSHLFLRKVTCLEIQH